MSVGQPAPADFITLVTRFLYAVGGIGGVTLILLVSFAVKGLFVGPIDWPYAAVLAVLAGLLAMVLWSLTRGLHLISS